MVEKNTLTHTGFLQCIPSSRPLSQPSIGFLHPFLLRSGSHGAGAYPSCLWVKAGLHPGQVTTLSQAHFEAYCHLPPPDEPTQPWVGIEPTTFMLCSHGAEPINMPISSVGHYMHVTCSTLCVVVILEIYLRIR